MAAIRVVKVFGELPGIGEIPVVDQDNSPRGVHIKRLRFLLFFRISSGRIANVAQSDRSWQSPHVSGAVALSDLPFGLIDVQRLIIRGSNSR